MTKAKITIEDNFLNSELLSKIQEVMMGPYLFAWYYSTDVDYANDEHNTNTFQFIHMFYQNSAPQEKISVVSGILERIKPIAILRIKANLSTRTPHIVENKFHTDIGGIDSQLNQWTTSVFYVNSNDGYTEFEDGTKVESVANRLVSFPADMEHRGTSCTNENIRVIINFNYMRANKI